MSETKDEIAEQRDRLLAENENLRGQLAAAGAARPGLAPVAQHRFVLSEGQRQELAQHGNVLVDGQYLDADQLRAKMGEDQAGVELEVPATVRQLPAEVTRDKIPGVDFIYPSVNYGEIDPALAGTPGVSGPPARG